MIGNLLEDNVYRIVDYILCQLHVGHLFFTDIMIYCTLYDSLELQSIVFIGSHCIQTGSNLEELNHLGGGL